MTDTQWQEFPVCPHCGFEDQDWWDGLAGSAGDGDCWPSCCGACGQDYLVTMCVSTEFCTKPEVERGG